jgi:hypothetical protein
MAAPAPAATVPAPTVLPKLFFLYLTDDVTYRFSTGDLPSPANGDVTLIVRNTGSGNIEYGINVTGSEQPYTRKHNCNTIYQTAATPDQYSLAIVEEAAPRSTFFFFKSGVDPGPVVNSILNGVFALAGDPVAVKTEIDKILNIFTTGGKYQGSIMQSDGSMTGVQEQTYVSGNVIGAATVTDDTFTASTPDNIVALINKVLPAIVYDGFNPAKVRRAFIARNANVDIITRDLLLAFSAYAFIGNNVGKLAIKRVDVDIGKELMDAVGNMGIKKADKTSAGLTLPRLAIAFMPEYLIFRKFMAKNLQSQTESNIAVAYKDIVFYGCQGVRDLTGYGEFHKEFSAYIYSRTEDTDQTDAKFLKTYERWNKIVRKGYLNDNVIHNRMTNAIATTSMTERAVFDYVKNAITGVYAAP